MGDMVTLYSHSIQWDKLSSLVDIYKKYVKLWVTW